jgi:hypothetical protein
LRTGFEERADAVGFDTRSKGHIDDEHLPSRADYRGAGKGQYHFCVQRWVEFGLTMQLSHPSPESVKDGAHGDYGRCGNS